MHPGLLHFAAWALRYPRAEKLALLVADRHPGRLRRFMAANHHLPPRVVVEHDHGSFTMVTGKPVCLIAQIVWLDGWLGYENPLPLIIPALADHGASLVVGANSGYYVMLLAQQSAAQVTAFEPYPTAFARLEENVADNGLDHVRLRSCAIGAVAGSALLHLPEPHHENWPLEGSASLDATFKSRHSGSITVDVAVLDQESLPSPPELIVIDVEGFEAEVLAGADGLLRRARPFLVVEVSDASLSRVTAALDDQDYVSFELTDDGLRQQTVLMAARHTALVNDSTSQNRYWNVVLAPHERVDEMLRLLSDVVPVQTIPCAHLPRCWRR